MGRGKGGKLATKKSNFQKNLPKFEINYLKKMLGGFIVNCVKCFFIQQYCKV